MAIIDRPGQTSIEDRPATVRPATAGNQNTGGLGNQVVNKTASATLPGLLPSQVFERARWQREYAAKLLINDGLVVCAAVVLAQYVRFGGTYPPGHNSIPSFSVLFVILWLSALAGFHTRSPRLVGTGVEEYRRVIAASFGTFGAIAIVTLLLKIDIARGYLAVAFPVGTIGLVLSRWMWHRHVARRRGKGRYQTAVFAFGEREAVTNLASELTRNSRDGYQVVGVGMPGYGPRQGEHLTVNGQVIPIVGGETDMLQAIHTFGADTVAIAGTEHFGVEGIRRLIWDLEPMGVDLVVSTGFMDVALSRLAMRPIAGLPVLHVQDSRHGAGLVDGAVGVSC